jgi:hypothetical protein
MGMSSLDLLQHPADYAALRDFVLANAERLVYRRGRFRLQRSKFLGQVEPAS